MAAWVGKMSGAGSDGRNITLRVSFYDATDTGFTTVLASEDFSFDPSTTRAQMRDTIIARGTEIRAVLDAAKAFLVQFPLGTTLNIP